MFVYCTKSIWLRKSEKQKEKLDRFNIHTWKRATPSSWLVLLQKIGWKYPTRWYPWGIQKLVSTYSLKTENTQCQDLPKFQFGEGEAGYSGQVKTEYTQSAKICLNFNFWEGVGLSCLKFQRRALWRIWTQIYCLRLVYKETCLCIKHSLSHVETNKYLQSELCTLKTGSIAKCHL